MPTTPITPARRVPADDRRKQLIDTAVELFARNGFAGTTTREIARAAGVNEAIIFRFFPHKDDLYAAILEHKSSEARTDALVGELHAAFAIDDDDAVIRLVVTAVIDHQRRDPRFMRLMLHSSLENHSFARQYRERHFQPLHEFLLEYVTARQRQGRFRAGQSEVLVRAILAVPVHHGLVETLLADDTVAFGPDVIDTYASLILQGLRAAPASTARSSESNS